LGTLDAVCVAAAMVPWPLLTLFWTPYADWIYTGVSITGLITVVLLVLKPRK
jgi:hypothetical protein